MGPVAEAWRKFVSAQYFTNWTIEERLEHAAEKLSDMEALLEIGTPGRRRDYDIEQAIEIIKTFLACGTNKVNWKQEGF